MRMTLRNRQFSFPKILLLLAGVSLLLGLALRTFAGRAAQAPVPRRTTEALSSSSKSTGTALRSEVTVHDQFIEVAEKSGIRFSLTSGGPEKRYIIEAKGGGIAWIDYDNDGGLEIMVSNMNSAPDLLCHLPPITF